MDSLPSTSGNPVAASRTASTGSMRCMSTPSSGVAGGACGDQQIVDQPGQVVGTFLDRLGTPARFSSLIRSHLRRNRSAYPRIGVMGVRSSWRSWR